jgi:16S rRNA G966 N2-methylase RsmD
MKNMVTCSFVNLNVHHEIESLLLPLSGEELKFLEESILKEGIRDPLVVWSHNGEHILLDGHHRLKIAEKHGLNYKVVEKNFETLEEAKLWVLTNQLGRRNLTDEQRTYIIGKRYLIMKKSSRGFEDRNLSEGQFVQRTSEQICSSVGLNERTVRRAADFAEVVDKIRKVKPTVAEKILKGEVKDAKTGLVKVAKEPEVLSKVVEKIDGGTKKVKAALRQIVIEGRLASPSPTLPSKVTLFNRNFTEVGDEIPPESVDLILTDPPYGKDYLPLWDQLGAFAQRILKKGGFLIAYSGQLYLGDVLSLLQKHLEYYWTFALILKTRDLVSGRDIHVKWKPIVCFFKSPLIEPSFFTDVIEGSGREKDWHEWEQSQGELHTIIENFAPKNGVVLDPMSGSGATLLAALKLGRRVIGVEVDKETFEILKARMGNEEKEE